MTIFTFFREKPRKYLFSYSDLDLVFAELGFFSRQRYWSQATKVYIMAVVFFYNQSKFRTDCDYTVRSEQGTLRYGTVVGI